MSGSMREDPWLRDVLLLGPLVLAAAVLLGIAAGLRLYAFFAGG